MWIRGGGKNAYPQNVDKKRVFFYPSLRYWSTNIHLFPGQGRADRRQADGGAAPPHSLHRRSSSRLVLSAIGCPGGEAIKNKINK